MLEYLGYWPSSQKCQQELKYHSNNQVFSSEAKGNFLVFLSWGSGDAARCSTAGVVNTGVGSGVLPPPLAKCALFISCVIKMGTRVIFQWSFVSV